MPVSRELKEGMRVNEDMAVEGVGATQRPPRDEEEGVLLVEFLVLPVCAPVDPEGVLERVVLTNQAVVELPTRVLFELLLESVELSLREICLRRGYCSLNQSLRKGLLHSGHPETHIARSVSLAKGEKMLRKPGSHHLHSAAAFA